MRMPALPALLALSLICAWQPASAGIAIENPAPVVDTIEGVRQATVTIRLAGSDGEEAAVGAGFLDAGTGMIVTNAHVVDGRTEVQIGAADGRIATARVVARDEVHDIALLAADLPGLPRLSFATTPARVGETIYAVGSPFGLGQSVTRGIVSALDRAIDVTTPFGMVQHDAPLNPGSSGGPVVNQRGEVVGINTAMPDGFRRDVGIAYAIPAAVAAGVVARLAAKGDLPVRHLGVSLRALTPRLAAAVGVAAGAGVLVEAVLAGSAAAGAGLAPADVIVAIGDTTIGELRDVAIALDRVAPEDAVDVFVIRGTEKIVLTLPPAAPAAATANLPGPAGTARPWIDATELGFALAEAGPARIAVVGQGTAAVAAGMVVGDTVLAVGRTRAASAFEVRRLIGPVVTRPFALLLADSTGATRYVVVDPWAPGLDGDGLGGNMRHPRSASF